MLNRLVVGALIALAESCMPIGGSVLPNRREEIHWPFRRDKPGPKSGYDKTAIARAQAKRIRKAAKRRALLYSNE